MSKRKSSNSSLRKGVVVDPTDDDPEEPVAKSILLSSTLLQGDRQRNQEGRTAPSTSSSISLKSSSSSKRIYESHEQDRRTNSYRVMRKMVIRVIYDFHEDLKNNRDADCLDLVKTILSCWKKYPLMFAHVPKALKIPDNDLSSSEEIKEFLPWWLHGLSSLLFFKEVQPFRSDLIALLKTIAQGLINGNSEFVEVCFLELLKVLVEFSKPERQPMRLTLLLKTNENGEEEDESVKQLDIEFEMDGLDEYSISDFLDVVLMFLPRVFNFKIIMRQQFLIVLREFWTSLNDMSKFKLFSTFFITVLPLLATVPTTDRSIIGFVTEIISNGSNCSDSHNSLFNFVKFCDLMWKGVLPMGILSEEFLLMLHSSISTLIVAEQFKTIPSDARKGIVKLYLSLTGESSKIYGGTGDLRGKDMTVFIKATDTWPSIDMSHPLLEETIFDELKTAFHTQTSAEPSPVSHFRDRKKIKINSKVESKLWGKIFKEFSASNNIQKLCSTIQLGGRLNGRLLKHVMKFNSGAKHGVIWMPDFDLLTIKEMEIWTELIENCILQSIRDNASTDKILNLVLDSMRAFWEGNSLFLKLPINLSCRWVTIVGIPWLMNPKLKNRLPKKFVHAKLLNCSSDILSTGTKAKCLNTLALQMFLPFKDFVIDVTYSVIEERDIIDKKYASVLLEMISFHSWTIRNISWNTIVTYLSNVMHKLDWKMDAEIRKKLAKAIVILPCVYSNQKQKHATELSLMDRLKLETQPCSLCNCNNGQLPQNWKDIYFLDSENVIILIRLCLPILEARFIFAKMELGKLISAISLHSKGYSEELIAAFTTTAAQSSVSVGTEIMKHLCFYFNNNNTVKIHPCRKDSMKRFFYTLDRRLEDSLKTTTTKQKNFIRCSMHICTILQPLLALNADQLMMVEILKFGLRIIVLNRDRSNVLDMLIQSLVGVLASKSGCLPWELITRLRYELSEEIVELGRIRFAVLTDPDDDNSSSDREDLLQAERFREFLSSICTMGEFRTSGTFIHHFYPILLGFIIPSLYEDKKMQFIFKNMMDFASVSASQILQDGFHNYYPVLIILLQKNHQQEKLGKALSFIKENYGFHPNVVAFSVLQATLYEMLFHLNEWKHTILKYVPHLLRRDPIGINITDHTKPEELIISKNILMGYFVFVNTKLHSNLESLSTKQRILQSFTVLIELMGKTSRIMKTNRTKVYATLNSLFSLGPDFHALIFEAWKVFATNLENSVFGQMSSQILAAVLVLKETLPQQVENLIYYFVVSKNELTLPYHQELYFLLDSTKDANVQKTISDCVNKLKLKSWRKYFELIVKESSNENSHIRYRAMVKLKSVLIEEYKNLNETILLEKENPVVSQLLYSFLNASRDAADNNDMLMLVAESLGALGAVDPYRFKYAAEGDEQKRKLLCTPTTFTVTGPNFATKFLDLLIREFQESENATDFDCCACLIQQVLKHYNVTATESDPVWFTMSREARELMEPLLTSKYKVEKKFQPKPNVNNICPIYLSENGRTFDQWLSNWLMLMITYIREGTLTSELFKFTKYMISRNINNNNRVASFLLPYVTTFALIEGNKEQRSNIVKEVEKIFQLWIDQDAFTETETKLICDEDNVFQYRCTQEIFSVFDHLFRCVRHAKRQSRLLSNNNNNNNNNIIAEENAEIIDRVLLSKIPMSTISKVAFHCENYTRALFYVEQDLKKNPDKFQDMLNYLQRLYVSLNDMDSVVGVSAIRKCKPTMSDIILENIANGKMEVAVRRLECTVNEDPNNLITNHGLLEAYMSMDDPTKANNLLNACISSHPQWEIALNEIQLQVTWKLGDWSQLLVIQTQMATNSIFFETHPSSWNMTIVKILSFVKDMKLENAMRILKQSRVKLMSPFIAGAKGNNDAYKRGYPNVVQLHILTEVEQVIEILMENYNHIIKVEQTKVPVQDRIESLNEKWDARLRILCKSQQKFVDAVLDVRRTLLETFKDAIIVPNDEAATTLIDESIRDCWLKVASVESKCGNFTRAFNCLLEAKKYNNMSAKVMIEDVKLLDRKGDREQAIRALQSGLTEYFPKLNEWKQTRCEVGELGDLKLCSKALLLYAKLCDEQQLLDFEENVKNYKSATEVFQQSEKNYYNLASYYDRICSSNSGQPEFQSLIVRYYGRSLHYGCKYVYQSLPRLFSIWFQYSSIGYQTPVNSYQNSPPDQLYMSVNQMQDSIKDVMKDVPTYILLTAFSQLVSRLCHSNPMVWNLLKEIIGSIICNHPHQALWMTMAISKSSYAMRRNRCNEIYKYVETKKPALKKMIVDYTLLADKLIAVCAKDLSSSFQNVKMSNINQSLPKLLSSSTFGDVLIPFQVFLSPSLPSKGGAISSYNAHDDAFPQNSVFIKGVHEYVTVMASLQKPKKINLLGSNGKTYGLLCKAKDDLRKDCKVMEMNNVVNSYLHRNLRSRQRQLHVRMYAVTPLNEGHGLLEWVPGLNGYLRSVISIYRELGIATNLDEIKSILDPADPLSVSRNKYQIKLINPHPPVFSKWFQNNFNDPRSWYNARLAYTRTTAVMSIVGYVLGLGDRHGENILLDSSTGEVVHVDFNCLFNKGEKFDIPERVPFRLTQNMVEAMGPLGVEGVFRRSCEITMNMIRNHKSIFMSVIQPFVFDPLVEWNNNTTGTGDTEKEYTFAGELMNGKAVEIIKHIKNRIDGSARNCTKVNNTVLSVEAQVAYLIDEARSVDNLCQMYIGWTAYI